MIKVKDQRLFATIPSVVRVSLAGLFITSQAAVPLSLRLFRLGVYASHVGCSSETSRGIPLVKSNLNLASKPFNNRVLPWMLTVVVLFVSIVGLFLVVVLTTGANRESTKVQAEINELKQKEESLLKNAQAVQQSLSPQQQESLRAAHALIDRKVFSWSRLFGDLEASLPGTVRVSRIAVRNVTAQADGTVAELELAVFAKNATTITEMMSSMNRGGIFDARLQSQNLQKGRGEIGTEYELLVVYRPRAGFLPERVAQLEGTENPKGEGK